MNLRRTWISLLRRRCFPAEEPPGAIPAGAASLPARFRSLGSRTLRPLSWKDVEEEIRRARLLLYGSWHPLELQAEAAGALAARLARRGDPPILALGMVRRETLRRGALPRGLPETFLPALLRGLGAAVRQVPILGLGGTDRGLGDYGLLVEKIDSLLQGGRKVLLLQGELHLLPPMLPRALEKILPQDRIRTLWPGAPGPWLRLAGKGPARRPARVEGKGLYLPLCHPLHRPASLQAWRERAPLLPPTRRLPWLPPGPSMEEAFHDLARRTARLLGLPLPRGLKLLTFEEEDPWDRIDREIPPGPAREAARRALAEGEGLALPHLSLVVLGGPGALEAAEEAAHLLHLARTELHRVPQESLTHQVLSAALAEAVARGAARLVLPGSPPWRPRLDLVPPEALSWKRSAWARLRRSRLGPPSAERLTPFQAGAAAHLIGYALAESIIGEEDGPARLARLARTAPPRDAARAFRILQEALP